MLKGRECVKQPVKSLEDARRDPITGRVLCVDFGPPASACMPVLAVTRPPPVDSDGFAQARRPAPMMLGSDTMEFGPSTRADPPSHSRVCSGLCRNGSLGSLLLRCDVLSSKLSQAS